MFFICMQKLFILLDVFIFLYTTNTSYLLPKNWLQEKKKEQKINILILSGQKTLYVHMRVLYNTAVKKS